MRQVCSLILATAIVVLLGIPGRSVAADGCCAHCGCQSACQKVCRLVCEEKKVPVICWGCKCEDLCIPKHSKPGCRHCEVVCDEPTCELCAHSKNFVWTEWIPGCAKIHTKKKLMKKTVTKRVPSYKWVVEDLCSQCQAKCDPAELQPAGAAGLAGPGPIAASIGDHGQVAPASFAPASFQPAPFEPTREGKSINSFLPTWKR